MRLVYCVCGIEYGVKAPDDDRITHGLGRSCLPNELKRIKKELTAFKMVPTEAEQKNTYSASTI
jgi:hypothetical protein